MNSVTKVIIGCIMAFFITGCASTTRLNFACDDPTIDIYIDGEYVGRDLVNYTFPKGKQTIVVSCIEDGVEVYHRTYYVGSYQNNELINLQIQRDYQYSTGSKKAKTR